MNRMSLLALASLALVACSGDRTAPAATADTVAPDTTAVAQPAADAHNTLEAAITSDARDPANSARDRYRHPLETLRFFGVRDSDMVVEITPGGGWYAEILAPWLRERGHYVAAVVDPAAVAEGRGRDYQTRARQGLEEKFAAAPERFNRATFVGYDPAAPAFGPAGSADAVLTFRNVHNWRSAGQAEGMFKGFFDVLKPGGVLGVVEHRAARDVPADDRSGYVSEAQVIALAEAAGFRLDEKSEVNANPLDTKDHPNGVWTLPPSSNHDAADAEKYQAIGESDRMTLRFVKP